jgi:hypothetical protein
MSNIQPTRQDFEQASDLSKRIALVMNVQKRLGYVNRNTLMKTYMLSQQEAGSLMRDFIHAYAKNLEWNMSHSHYRLKD